MKSNGGVGAQYRVPFLVRGLAVVSQSDCSADDVEGNGAFVEEQIAFTSFIELRWQTGGREDCVAGSLPGSTFSTSVYDWFDHVETNIVYASRLKDGSPSWVP